MTKREAKVKPRRQVVIIIVDGQSDENALSVALTQAFESKYGDDVRVYFAKIINDDGREGGDITSKNGVIPSKTQMLINKLIITPFFEKSSLMATHVTEIIHIIDTDGLYIPDSQIINSDNLNNDSSLEYCDNEIYASNPGNIISRNLHKRANVEALLQFHDEGFDIQKYIDTDYGSKPTTKATKVPYSLYYFSCNLDHFIEGNPNLGKYEKMSCADKFARGHGQNLISFRDYIFQESPLINAMSHEESWKWIMIDCNSLKRFSNIGLLIKSLTGEI